MKSLLKRAQAEGTPILNGDTATFVWRGRQAPRLIGDFNDWEPKNALALTRTAPGVWTHTLELPRDAYIEYAYVFGQERAADPFNPRTTPDGVGGVNHYFYMPDGAPTPLIRRQRVPHGVVTRHRLPTRELAVGQRRTVYLYQPPTSEPCPLIVVLDGREYLRRARLNMIVDNLLAQRRIRPVALALVESRADARLIEYGCSESTVGFLLYNVLPLARAHLNLLDVKAFPGAYGVLGASMGGLMALYAALRAPQVFGRVLSQSGAFGFAGYDSVVFDLVRDGDVKPLRVWMDVGRFEDLLAPNRRMCELLSAKGYDATYAEHNGGHNYPAWRNDVWRGLEGLFGPQA